ncbi:hypothetical protein D3C81_1983790 [compost metagenome]
MIGIETNIVQIGGETEFVAIGGIGAKIQQHVAQPTGDFQMVNGRGETLRQRPQRIEQRSDRSQIETIRLQVPELVHLVGRARLLQLDMRLPTVFAKTHRQ